MTGPRPTLLLAAALTFAAFTAAVVLGAEPTRTPAPAAASSPPPAARPTPPPSPPLSPDAERATFTVQPGFRVDLVAAEPLIEAPVAMTFDPDGRLFVVEMRDFMPDADGKGEDAPTGRISVLDDTDGDGRMDKRTVFLDGLVLPRSVAFAGGGVLIAAPPQLIFCTDADHDDHCDSPQVVATDYGTRKNPEHDANGLSTGIDNWLYSANLGLRHRFSGGHLVQEPTITRGQWGISQDDFGRLIYNANSDYLRGDQLPVYLRAAHFRTSHGQNVALDRDQTTWPGRPNFGVNRGYQDGSLRADGTLAKFTAACGPTVYRGDQFPPEFRGNVFVAEPAANFVRRSVVTDASETRQARNAYEKREFLTSTDERFRPVNLSTGPDGTLYVADFYRGLIQHRIYLTPFLRQQVKERGLDAPVNLGRIWRVVSTAGTPGPRPHLNDASSATLLQHLAHPNGWWRDTAQRLLIDRKDPATTAPLVQLSRSAADPRTRLHALFTLEGMGSLPTAAVQKATRDHDHFVRDAAAALIQRGDEANLAAVVQGLAQRPPGDPQPLARALTPVKGRELDVLGRLLGEPTWSDEAPERAALLERLAHLVVAAARPDETLRLLDLVAAQPAGATWRQIALLQGVSTARRGSAAHLPDQPQGWAKVLRSEAEAVRTRAIALGPWMGVDAAKAARPAGKEARGLSGDQRAMFDRGRALYPGICGACHQPSGLGEEGKGPPLVESPWVLGTPERLVRIALHGLRGPVKVGKRTFAMEMPAMGGLADAQLAELLTYVRNERDWGHDAPPVDVATIDRIRKATAGRDGAWTADELLQVK
jgi:glucose/arabinose dehydrogenase/mono/diheme cytochrome c family protein